MVLGTLKLLLLFIRWILRLLRVIGGCDVF